MPSISPKNVYSLNINYKFACQIINFCVISVSINHLLKVKPYLCIRIFKLRFEYERINGSGL